MADKVIVRIKPDPSKYPQMLIALLIKRVPRPEIDARINIDSIDAERFERMLEVLPEEERLSIIYRWKYGDYYRVIAEKLGMKYDEARRVCAIAERRLSYPKFREKYLCD